MGNETAIFLIPFYKGKQNISELHFNQKRITADAIQLEHLYPKQQKIMKISFCKMLKESEF